MQRNQTKEMWKRNGVMKDIGKARKAMEREKKRRGNKELQNRNNGKRMLTDMMKRMREHSVYSIWKLVVDKYARRESQCLVMPYGNRITHASPG